MAESEQQRRSLHLDFGGLFFVDALSSDRWMERNIGGSKLVRKVLQFSFDF